MRIGVAGDLVSLAPPTDNETGFDRTRLPYAILLVGPGSGGRLAARGPEGVRNRCDEQEAGASQKVKTHGIHERADSELLALARSAPESLPAKRAASELLARYQQRVYAWCVRHVRDHDQALDLAQEVLISAYRNLASFESRARFSSWLFAIARNRCLSALRRPRLLYEEERDPDQLCGETPGPEEAL
ncbi:MAG: sigma-70 family RNA polymerase sigma factor, partial [Candidatus Eisenbacteria bacterium]|nr:sigma-70 family RNA polymerase sigma factor [Candidatus Eisenbacteria bacterium]